VGLFESRHPRLPRTHPRHPRRLDRGLRLRESARRPRKRDIPGPAVGRLGRDQVADDARRKGMPLYEVGRWLAPNLGYEVED
jgi:hypothetical protein